jgi:DNA-binding NtrC family response regulator
VNVLVVDNEIDQVENLRIGLSNKGYHVLQTQNGHEALNLIENDALGIELVITDYDMPGINGIELLLNIRQKHGNMPVILMTAYGWNDIIINARQNHCNGFINKPFTLDLLLHEIEKVKGAMLEDRATGTISVSSADCLHPINASDTSEEPSTGTISS